MTDQFEYEDEGSSSPSLTVSRLRDGTVTWSVTIPVSSADVDGFVAAVALVREVDAEIVTAFPQSTTQPASGSPRMSR